MERELIGELIGRDVGNRDAHADLPGLGVEEEDRRGHLEIIVDIVCHGALAEGRHPSAVRTDPQALRVRLEAATGTAAKRGVFLRFPRTETRPSGIGHRLVTPPVVTSRTTISDPVIPMIRRPSGKNASGVKSFSNSRSGFAVARSQTVARLPRSAGIDSKLFRSALKTSRPPCGE